MPLYDYDCDACGRRFEVIHGVNDPSPERCPLCGSGPIRKAFAPPAIHFKGSGWAKKERRAAVKSGASSGEGEKASDADGSSNTDDKTSTTTSSSGSSTASSSPSDSGSTSSPSSTSSGSGD